MLNDLKSPPDLMITQVPISNVPQLDRQLKNELMKELSPQDLSKIKKGFDMYRGTVEINQFIVLMIDALYGQYTVKNYEKEVLTFIELFLLIDISSTGKIRFENFTNFLIDRQSSQQIQQQYKFFPARGLSHLQVYADLICPLKNNKSLALLNNNRKNIDLVDTKSFKAHQNISFGGVLINCVSYIESQSIYVVSTNDKHLNFYDTVQNILVQRFSIPDSIYYIIVYNDKLLTGSNSGFIYEYSIQKLAGTFRKKNQDTSSVLNAEKNEVNKMPPSERYKYFLKHKVVKQQPDLTCFDIMESLDILVTGSNDSIVRLYQMRKKEIKITKQLDGHYKGIKAVSVSVHHKVIVSCSFDFDLLVWNAYLQHPVARLEGHQAPLVSVYCPKKFEIIVSLDSKGIMKIWNSESYSLNQNIQIFGNNPVSNNISLNFVYKQQCNIAIIYTKKLIFYQFTVNYDPRLTDDTDISAIKYSGRNLELYIGSKRSLKIWSIEKGILLRTYHKITESEISVLQLDDKHRRVFIGTIEGQVVAVDLFSGLVVNNFSSHNQEVSVLLYDYKNQLLISGSWDRNVKVHNDTRHLDRIEQRDNVLRNIMNMHDKQLSNGAFSPAELMIGTHCRNRVLRLWDYQKGYLQGQLVIKNDINLVHFLSPFPLILIADTKGGVFILTSKYAKNPYKLVHHWRNMYSIQKASQITYISTQHSFKGNTLSSYKLLLGDEYGYIRILQIAEFLNREDYKPITEEILGKKNPHRLLDYKYSGSSQLSVNTHDYSGQQSKNIVPPAYFIQTLQMKAHSDRVNYISMIYQQVKPLLISSGSDRLVKIWSIQGQPRGTLRQGQKENPSWRYKLDQNWKTKQIIQYQKVHNYLDRTFEEYLQRKRASVIPFTEDEKFGEINNDDIYKNLKQIDVMLHKDTQKEGKRLY